jgi:hypothetical protein
MSVPRPRDDRAHEDEVLRELEAAWEQWVRGNPPGDARTSSLLRAAFAAGYQAGHDATASEAES